MKTISKNEWVDKYFNWLKEKTISREVEDWTEISTPFLNRHNDGIVLYVKKLPDNTILISDDGYTINDLEMCGFSFDSKTREKILNNYLLSFGLKLNNKEILVEATEQNYAQKKHFLIQGILAINDMFVLHRNQVANIFIDDMISFFDDYDIRYTSDVKMQGTSGLLHKIDFVISKSKVSPERIITAINSPSTQSAQVALFQWQDIQPIRKPDSLLLVFLNDKKHIANSIIDAFKAYNTVPILWSKRTEHIDKLIS